MPKTDNIKTDPHSDSEQYTAIEKLFLREVDAYRLKTGKMFLTPIEIYRLAQQFRPGR